MSLLSPRGPRATINSPLVDVSGEHWEEEFGGCENLVCLLKTSRALSGDLPGSARGGRAPTEGGWRNVGRCDKGRRGNSAVSPIGSVYKVMGS